MIEHLSNFASLKRGKIEFIFYKHHFKFNCADFMELQASICKSFDKFTDVEIIELNYGFISNHQLIPNIVIKLSNDFPLFLLFSQNSKFFDTLCYYLQIFQMNYKHKSESPLNIFIKFKVKVNDENISINLQVNNNNINGLREEKHDLDSLMNFIKDLNEYVCLKSLSIKFEEEYPFWSFNIFEGELKSTLNKVRV